MKPLVALYVFSSSSLAPKNICAVLLIPQNVWLISLGPSQSLITSLSHVLYILRVTKFDQPLHVDLHDSFITL